MNKKEMNNKGFSLVELIIVIAIMAILVGALAPQFLKYVERSRKSTDCQNVAAIITALQVYAADPNVASDKKITTGAVIKITPTATAVSATNASNNTNLALDGAAISSLQLKSSNWGVTDYTITVTVDSNGALSFAEPTGMKTMADGTTKFSIIEGRYE